MPPGKKRGTKEAKAVEYRLGDLVLAKVKGFPHWPAKVSNPEEHNFTHDPKKYFVEFFGTKEIAFVAPADIQAFTTQKKKELTTKCKSKSKTIKFFAEAVEEICQAFEMLQSIDLDGIKNDNSTLNLASETTSQDAAVGGVLKVGGSDGTNKGVPNSKSEIIGMTVVCSDLEGCLQKQDAVECEDIESRVDVKHNLPPQISPGKNTDLAANPANVQKGSASTHSPSHHSQSHPKEDGYCDIKGEGRNPSGDQSELTNGHQPNNAILIKKVSENEGLRVSGSAISHEKPAEAKQIETPVDGHKKVPSVDNLASGSDVAISHEDVAEAKQLKTLTDGHKKVSSVDYLTSGSAVAVSCEKPAEAKQIKTPAHGHKVSSVEYLTSGSDVNCGRKDKRSLKERKDYQTADNVQVASKKKLKGAGSRNNDSAISHENASVKQVKTSAVGHKKVSSVDNLTSSSDVNRGRKDKRLPKKKVDNVQAAVMKKKKLEGATSRKHDSAISREHAAEMKQIKSPLGGHKVSSIDNLASGSDLNSERKDKRLPEEKKDPETADNVLVDPEGNSEYHSISRKKVNAKRGHDTTEVLSPAKLSKHADAQDISMVKAQMGRKDHSRDPNVDDDKMTNVESKRSSLGAKAENHHPLRMQMHEANHSDEDDLPPMKLHRQTLEAKSSSLASENKFGTSTLRKNDLLPSNKIRSSAVKVPTKRRAVLRCDEDDDELPKTPVHGGSSSKVSAISRVSDSKKKSVMQGGSNVLNKSVSRNLGASDRLTEQAKVVRLPNRGVVPTARQGTEKANKDISHVHIPSTFQSEPEKLSSVEPKPALVSPLKSPRFTTSTRPSAELQNKLSTKVQGSISEKKVAAGSNKGLAPASSIEKGKSTPKSDFVDPLLVAGNSSVNIALLSERLDLGKEKRTTFSDSKTPDSVTTMRNLIAAAQARKKQAHVQNSFGNSFSVLVHDTDILGRTPSPTPAMITVESTNILQLEVQDSHLASHTSDARQLSSVKQHENEEQEERRVSSGHRATGSSLSGGTEAAVARDAFEGMIETLSRTKESIGRATRLAIDCAKYGIANEVVELLIKKLENEPSFHRRVDLFFLVDSITQCSHQKGSSYIPIVQAALPRLIGAAAPPGSGAQENRRQCHKVLRLWLERKIFPESVLRRYMDDIGVTKNDISGGYLFRRPSRAERAIDDPIREMEGMFVDEYGSNATFQLPGLLSIRPFDEDEDEDEDDFPSSLGDKVADTSPSLHTPAASTDPENNPVTPSDRRHCILEDVDGELEMEDVSGHQKDEKTSFSNGTIQAEHNSSRIVESGSSMHAELLPSPNSPPFPDGTPPPTPPLPNSPLPPLSPPLPPPPSSSPAPPPPPPQQAVPFPPQQHQFLPPPCPAAPPPYAAPSSSVGPPLPAGRPPHMLPQQSLQHQPAFMSQHMPPPPPLAREIGSAPAGNQRPLMVPIQGSHFDSSLKSDVMSQQSSCFPPAGISNVQEKNIYNAARPVEYGPGDVYMNTQQRQQFVPGVPPFVQRPLHSERPPQFPPNQFSYGNSAHQYHYPPYPMPNFPDGLRRSAGDEQLRMKANEFNSDGPRGGWMSAGRLNSGPYPYEGYYGPPTERPPPAAVTFQPSRPDTLPAVTPIPVHGASMMSGRPDMSSVNWRPA